MKLFHLLVLFTISVISCKNTTSAQSKNSDAKTTNPNYFSKEEVTPETATKPSFCENYILNKDAYLNVHFLLEQPLIKNLQALAPNLSEIELLELGSFQFTFLVDDEIVYVENLNTGAGLAPSKTERLAHNIRLVAPKQLDYWGWFMWLKFIKLGGGQDALNEGKHVLSIEIRPYIKQDTIQTGKLLAKGSIKVDVPEIIVDQRLIDLQEIQPNSGWKKSTAKFDVQKIEALNKKIAQQRFESINGIVVIKEGSLLIEEYFNGEGRDSLHDPRSVGKTIASSMLGIAIEDQHISDEHMLLKDFYDLKTFKNHSPEKEAVTLKSLLTMSSGFLGDDNDYSNPGNEENMYPTKDWVKFALNLPMDKEKRMGKDFAYFTAGIVVLGDIIHKSVPDGLVAYADKKLFNPLGITNYRWEYTPQKIGNTAGGIRLRALDFAKYGQLYKNKGVWNGQRLLTEDWVSKSLSKHIEQSLDQGHYGYLFWNKTYTIDDEEYEVSFCSGMGGNKIFIFKDLPFVIVITSSAYRLPNAHTNVDKMMTDYILPAILNKS